MRKIGLSILVSACLVVGLTRAQDMTPTPVTETTQVMESDLGGGSNRLIEPTQVTETAPSMEPAQVYYRRGLDAYLQGDYDQAILLTAKSVQSDPNLKKAQDLLSVLVLEKEQGSQTEIWLSRKKRDERIATPTPVAAPAAKDGQAEIWAEIRGLQKQIGLLADGGQVRTLQKRMTSLVRLMEKAANGNYGEIQASQAKTLERIEKISGQQAGQGRSLFWLFVLAILSVTLSVFALLRKPTAINRTLRGESDSSGDRTQTL